jgi:hypothetical protein
LLLFYGYLETPTDEVIHSNYDRHEILSERDEENLGAMGYSKKSLNNIKKNLRDAGML